VVLLAQQAPKTRAAGTLTIDSTPPATVRVDGRRIGKTPIRRHSLRAGAHLVELSNQVLGAKRELHIVINPGKETRLVVDLQR
jgi:hypothetical protein